MDKIHIYNQAIAKWGRRSQMDMIVEECSELIQAIQKYKRNPKDKSNLLEEIADVEIMCEQARIMFDNDNTVDYIKDVKINRLLNRLNL